MKRIRTIPVIDLFAGPGGLAEGFTSFEGNGAARFEVRLSVEKDPIACETLRLRKFFHSFDEAPSEYFSYVRGELPADQLFASHSHAARLSSKAVWQAELGKTNQAKVNERVREALGNAKVWVLVGGPPCQAYSIVGRSRMRTTHKDFEADERHFLYREYLRIVAHHAPPIFVMENVKGLLSATHGGEKIFKRILDDLTAPGKALRIEGASGLQYKLHALAPVNGNLLSVDGLNCSPEDFLMKAEQHGIPQTRHRVFILGVRSDINTVPRPMELQSTIDAFHVLDDLPAIRSRLSKEEDSSDAWIAAVRQIETQRWYTAGAEKWAPIAREIKRVLRSMSDSTLTSGGAYMSHADRPSALAKWYRTGMKGLIQHESRSHMREDLHRYLFAAAFARVHDVSPRLRDFPSELLPAHKNVGEAIAGSMFNDRFRVQLSDRPATTITSHISKDGHYFIHFAPEQCRSFTVREAARIQTFPDSYFFHGNRTQQFHQVGNAVPPLLAANIAELVHELVQQWLDDG